LNERLADGRAAEENRWYHYPIEFTTYQPESFSAVSMLVATRPMELPPVLLINRKAYEDL
jgi:hypothetical protein